MVNASHLEFKIVLDLAHYNLTRKLGRPEHAPNTEELQAEVTEIEKRFDFGIDYLLQKYSDYASWCVCPEWQEQLQRWQHAEILKKKKGGSKAYNTASALKTISTCILSLETEEAKAFIKIWHINFKLCKLN